MRTNLAIIGYGYMGKIYKKACLELYSQKNIETYYKYNLPGMLKVFTLKAVVDTGFVESYYDTDEGIWYFNSLQDLLLKKELGINAAVVSTPIKTHYNVAMALMSQNISLLIEKPVCETAKEIKTLIAHSRKNRVKIMPGHVERYNPVTLDAADAVKFGIYGKVKGYSFLRESSKPERVIDNLIIDKLIHDLDLVERIFGAYRIADVQTKRIDGEIMKCVIYTAHRKGYHGEIVSSWLAYKKNRHISIFFERGVLNGDLIEKKIDIERHGEFSKQISGYQNDQIRDQLVDFIAYKNRFIKPLVTMKDALRAAYLIDEINRRIENAV